MIPSPRVRASFAWSDAWVAAILVFTLMTGCAAGKADLGDTVLATANGEPVTVKDLDEGFDSSHKGHTALLAGSGAVREFLEKTIDRRLLVQEARRIGLDEKADIQNAVDELILKQARDQLYKDEVSRPPDISDTAIEQAYARMAVQYRVRHILMYTREDAEKAATRIRAGEAFGAVAAEVSVSPTAAKGGDLGFVTWGQLDPGLEAELDRLKQGELRGPLETDQGWNLLLLEATREWKERPELARQRSRIKATLGQRATSQRSHAYYAEIRARWKVQIHEEALTEANLVASARGGPAAAQAKGITVATAGERAITLEDLRARLNLDAVQKFPRSWALRRIRGILDDMAFGLLLEQEALRRGYDKRPEIASEAAKLEDALLLDRLLGTVVFPRVQVTENDVRAFYDQNPKHFTEPEAVRLSVIALEPGPEGEAVLGEVRGGADFAALARSRSKDPVTASVGGEMGWITRGKGNPAIEAVAFSLKVGEVGLASVEKAQFVMKLEDRRPERVEEFAAVKDKVRQMVLTQRRREEMKRWIAQLREGSEIVVDDTAIRRAVTAYEEEAREKAAARSTPKKEEAVRKHP